LAHCRAPAPAVAAVYDRRGAHASRVWGSASSPNPFKSRARKRLTNPLPVPGGTPATTRETRVLPGGGPAGKARQVPLTVVRPSAWHSAIGGHRPPLQPEANRDRCSWSGAALPSRPMLSGKRSTVRMRPPENKWDGSESRPYLALDAAHAACSPEAFRNLDGVAGKNLHVLRGIAAYLLAIDDDHLVSPHQAHFGLRRKLGEIPRRVDG
jgi:hypothetical protein